MLGTSADILFIGMLCICATLSALSAQYGRCCIPTVFSSCACIAVFLSAHSNVFILESVIASSAYIMLPRSFLHKLELCSENKSPALIEASLYSLQFKLREASQVICTVAKMFAPSGDERVKLANRQLLATGQLMVKLADGCMAEPIQRNYRVAVGAAACPKAGNEETGDSIAVREYDTNILLALSDGMGSGKKAHKESAAAVTLLSDLLSIGFDLKNALECVNMLMLQRSENDMYTTVDAVCINLSNLNASFVKQGAPDSYIVRGQKVFTLCSQALPIGILAQARASLHETKLRSGDFVFMMTDGMSESLCDLLPDILLDLPSQFEDLNAMADYLLCMARRLSDRDDMTIIIANIENMRKNS